MAEFVLIHGGKHGAWCWELLEPELVRLGHRTITVDLPVDQPGADIDDYAKAALAELSGKMSEDALLVAHSMGGLVAPRIALQKQVGGLIFLSAWIAPVTLAEHEANLAAFQPPGPAQEIDAQGLGTMEAAEAIKFFFHDVPAPVLEWALPQLRRQWTGAYLNVPLLEKFPDVRVHSIVCADDRALQPEHLRRMARQRFGIEPVDIEGSHSPFLARPAVLAAMLDRIAATG